MSLYAELLNVALAESTSESSYHTTGEALTALFRCRSALDLRGAPTEPNRAADSIASELAYDIALIGFARRLGIECGVIDFEQPAEGRAWIELALTSRGFTDELEPEL
jgi:hypothetical protein